jgi:hypothetical protein
MNLNTISLPKALVGKANKEEEKTISLSTSVKFSRGRIADLIQIPVWWLIYICLDSQPTPKPTNQPVSAAAAAAPVVKKKKRNQQQQQEHPANHTTASQPASPVFGLQF